MSSVESKQQNEETSSMSPIHHVNATTMVSTQQLPEQQHQHSFPTDDRMNMLFHSIQSIDSVSNIEDMLRSNSSLGITFETSVGCAVPNPNPNIFSSRSTYAGTFDTPSSVDHNNASSMTPSQSIDPLFSSNLFSSQSWAPRALDSNQVNFANVFNTNTSATSPRNSSTTNTSKPGKFDFNAMFQSQLAPNPPLSANRSSGSHFVPNPHIETNHPAPTSMMRPSRENTVSRPGKFDFSAMFHNQLPQNPVNVENNETHVSVNPKTNSSVIPGKFDFSAMYQSQLPQNPIIVQSHETHVVPINPTTNSPLINSHVKPRDNLVSDSSSLMPPPDGLPVDIDQTNNVNELESLSFQLENDAAIALQKLSNSSSSQQVSRSISLQETSNTIVPVSKPKRRRKRPNYDPKVKVFVNPTPEDVLMGRGGRTNHHPGNHRYLQTKEAMQDKYMQASKDKKTSISQELVDLVNGWGGRFLKLDTPSDQWYEVANVVARKKASQSLREINTAAERAAKRARYSKPKNGSSCSDSLSD